MHRRLRHDIRAATLALRLRPHRSKKADQGISASARLQNSEKENKKPFTHPHFAITATTALTTQGAVGAD